MTNFVAEIPTPPSEGSLAVVPLSGGMDSATLLYALQDAGWHVIPVSFNYGQRHGSQELRAAQALATINHLQHNLVDLTSLTPLLHGSALTDGAVDVPSGHYAADSMKATVVPNRNAFMLSLAYAIAVGNEAALVAYAAHSGDHDIYPDCRPDFVEALNVALRIGNEWADPLPSLTAPFVHISKAEIVSLGYSLGVPFELTYSCYKGGPVHCGVCGTCSERRQAFFEAGVVDPTQYVATLAETELAAGMQLH